MRKAIRLKASLFLFIELLQLTFPTLGWSLTGGPSQPEIESFEPISTDQMVDPFTGDFTYNIPLLTVPGPGGGYPINIAYHGGPNMDEEASWVGLGWNINAGVINRTLNGIPDDFSGGENEKIKEVTSYKPVRTFALTGGLTSPIPSNFEVFGAEFDVGLQLSASATVSINNYRGRSMTRNLGANFYFAQEHSKSKDSPTQVNPEDGTETWTTRTVERKAALGVGVNFSSRQGMGELTYGLDVSKKIVKSGTRSSTENSSLTHLYNHQGSGTLTFSSRGVMQPANTIHNNQNYRIYGVFGVSIPGISGESGSISGMYTVSKIGFENKRTTERPGIGYIHSSEVTRNSDHIMDFSFSNDLPIFKNSKVIPQVIPGQDLFFISGHGIGGQFKAYQGSVGLFTENFDQGHSTTFNLSPEFETGPFSGQIGLTAEAGYGQCRIGGITGNSEEFLEDYKFGRNESSLSEKFYFKLIGETSSNEDEYFGDASAFNARKFATAAYFEEGALRPSISSSNVPINADLSQRRKRRIRYQLIAYKSGIEILENDLFNQGGYVAPMGSTSELENITYSSTHKIEEFSVKNDNGQTYYYSLPAKNKIYKEVNFAVSSLNLKSQNKLYTEYEEDEAGTNNESGVDNYFYSKQIGEYAHSYLVTKITSPDYVDLTFNGPTEDDYGNYVKFGYYFIDNYKWRFPYTGANYAENNLNDDLDDKASYVYGEKELYYLKEIETKTHIARFKLSIRSDARGAVEELSNTFEVNPELGDLSYKLNSIQLFKKGENGEEILVQECIFHYDYSLFRGQLPNFSPVANEQNLFQSAGNSVAGKLTLRSITFKYGEFSTQKETPYIFEYYDTINGFNHNIYSPANIDKWGGYYQVASSNNSDYSLPNNPFMNPYLNQDTRDQYACLGNLKKISLPSGGTLTIDYESDDYAFVQNKKAMNMLRLAGIGNYTSFSFDALVGSNATNAKIRNNDRRLYFILDKQVNSLTEGLAAVNEALKDENGNLLKDIKFKIFTRLKKKPEQLLTEEKVSDYVEGYAKLANENGTNYGFILDASSPNLGYGYVDIDLYEVVNDGAFPSSIRNPLRVASLQHLRSNREDLLSFDDGSSSMPDEPSISMITGLINSISNVIGMVTGFYNTSAIQGWASDVSPAQPSFIRLYDSDSKKCGGGYRVKSIKASNFLQLTEGQIEDEIETKYFYQNEDGSSSGVAQNEPMIGGAENTLNQPLFQGSNHYVTQNPISEVTKPLLSALYPAASVGYSRVLTVQVPKNGTAKLSSTGIIEHKFYTCRDFPVKESFTTEMNRTNFAFSIPLIVVGGAISFQNMAFSQGFSIELNNMNGQLRSTKTFRYTVGEESDNNVNFDENFNLLNGYFGNCTTSNEFFYYTDEFGNLKNEVPVLLDQYGNVGESTIGVDHETHLGERQRSSWDASLGADMNINFTPISIPSGYPQGSYGEIFTRFLTVTSTSYRVGILKEIVSSVNGIRTSQLNRAFDKMTGETLVTESRVEGEQPITSMKFPAYWEYPSLGAASSNYRAFLTNSHVSIINGEILANNSTVNLSTILSEGDILEVKSAQGLDNYWVTSVDESQASIITQSGQVPGNVSGNFQLIVIESGKKNLQSLSSGSITFSGRLEDLVTYSVLNSVNQWLMQLGSNVHIGQPDELNLQLCNKSFKYEFDDLGRLEITVGSFPTESINTANYIPSFINDLPSGGWYVQLAPSVDGQFQYKFYNNNNELIPTPSNFDSGFYHWSLEYTCMENVIDASAFKFSDETPVIVDGELVGSTSLNPYLSGQKGRWMPVESYNYQIDRLQGQSEISQGLGTNSMKDGTFSVFINFIWGNQVPEGLNQENNWLKSSTLSLVNQNMAPLESKNAIDIYSTELLAEDENLVIATVSNSRYFECGFVDYEQAIVYANNVRGNIKTPGVIYMIDTDSHTGLQSRLISGPSAVIAVLDGSSSDALDRFKAVGNQKYTVSFWLKNRSDYPFVVRAAVNNDNNFIVASLNSEDLATKPIDGWQLVTLTFPIGTDPVTIKVDGDENLQCLVDDFRVQPFNSTMNTYVYDYRTYRLLAVLDDRNFASIYNYSVDGLLFQTKQETANGVYTTKSNSSNVK